MIKISLTKFGMSRCLHRDVNGVNGGKGKVSHSGTAFAHALRFAVVGALVILAAALGAGDASAQVRIDAPNGFALGATVYADTQNIEGSNFTYAWSRGKSSDNTFDATALGNGMPLTLTQMKWQNGEYDLLRLVVSRSGVLHTATYNVNVPTRGALRVVQTNGNVIGEIEAGKTLSVDIRYIVDENNRDGSGEGGTITITWISGSSTTVAATYTLDADDEARKYIGLRAVYTDAMGFTHPFEMTVRGTPEDLVAKKPLREVLSAVGAMSAQQAFNAVGSHLIETGDAAHHSYGKGFVDSPSAQVRVKINGTAVQTGEELLPALVRDDAWSGANSPTFTNLSQVFGLQSFALDVAGGGNSQRWGGWLRGSWGALEGTPNYDGREYGYEGQGVSFYGGSDGFMGNWRFGLAAGYHSSDIEMAFGADGLRNDNVTQTHYSLLPYAEYRLGNLRAKFIGGGGLGRNDIEEVGGFNCKVRMDSHWYFGGTDVEYAVLSGDTSDLVVNASYYRNLGEIEGKQCDNNARIGVPELSYKSGEAAVGARANFGKAEEFRPYFLMDFRKKLGDVHDDVGVDVGLGAEWVALPWIFQGEGRMQVGDLTTHKRHSVNGVLVYDRGWLRSELLSGLDQRTPQELAGEHSLDWVHRWSVSATSEHALNTVDFGIYAERRNSFVGGADSGTNTIGANVRVQLLAERK